MDRRPDNGIALHGGPYDLQKAMQGMLTKVQILVWLIVGLTIGCGGAPPSEKTATTGKTEQALHSSLASMGTPRGHAAATILADGKILITGGQSDVDHVETTEIYDPKTNTWKAGAPLNGKRWDHAMVTLKDGRPMVIGGPSSGTYTAEIFDGTKWVACGAATMPRMSFVRAFLLSDGTVVAMGGDPGDAVGYKTKVFTYAPATPPGLGTWTAAKTSTYHHNFGAYALLGDDSILAVAGTSSASVMVGQAERFVASTNTWIDAGPVSKRMYADAVKVPGGAIVVGGRYGTTTLTDADFYDDVKNTWTKLSPMNGPHQNATLVMLPSNGILVAGGGVATAEIYDATADRWSLIEPLSKPRTFHVTAQLGDTVLFIGGQTVPGFLFSPPEATVVAYRQSKIGESCVATVECMTGTCTGGTCVAGGDTGPTDTGTIGSDTGVPPPKDTGVSPTTDSGTSTSTDTEPDSGEIVSDTGTGDTGGTDTKLTACGEALPGSLEYAECCGAAVPGTKHYAECNTPVAGIQDCQVSPARMGSSSNYALALWGLIGLVIVLRRSRQV